MDIALIIFCVIGCLMFLGYLGAVYYTAYKDQHRKKNSNHSGL